MGAKLTFKHSLSHTVFGSLLAGVVCLGVISLSQPVQAAPITNFETLTRQQIEQSYYHDWNMNIKFRAAVRQLFARSKVAMPSWVRYGAGPSAPSQVVAKDGVNWVVLNTCKVHACGDNNLFILLNPPTKEIYGVAKLDRKLVWLGKPNPTQKAILSQASGYQ